MSRTIGIIGIGNVGGALAHGMVVAGTADTLVLIDKNQQKVAADALDFEDAMANLPYHTTIIVNDYAALQHADVIISTLGNIALQINDDNDRFAELAFTYNEAKKVGLKIKQSGFAGVLLVVTNPVDVITSLYQEITGLPKRQVIGTGTLLDSARMKRAFAHEIGIDPRSIGGYNLGEHGNSQFTAWSTVTALGKPASELAETYHLDLEKIDEESKEGGHRVFWGKLYTNYGIAAAAMRLAIAVLTDARTELVVSNYYEPLQTYLGYPAIIGREGVVKQLTLSLTEMELEKLTLSAAFIKEKYHEFSTK